MANESIYNAFERFNQHISAKLADIEGDSAYDIWLSKGNVGTEEDFLKSLKGPEGDPVKDHWVQICNDTLSSAGVWQRTDTGGKAADLFQAKQDWKGYFWFYVADVNNIEELYWELSSSTTHTGACVRYLIREGTGLDKLQNGWNKIEFELHDSTNLLTSWENDYSMSFSDNYAYYLGGNMTGYVNWQHINYIRLIVTPKNKDTTFDYYVNAMTIYNPYDMANTFKQIWVSNSENDYLTSDATVSSKPVVSWTPNNLKEGTHAIKVTITDSNGSQVLAYRKLEDVPFKLRKFSVIVRLSDTQHTAAGVCYLSTLNNGTSQVLAVSESMPASQFAIVRFDGELENWWKCYAINGSGSTTYNRYNTESTKYLSYPLGTRTSSVKVDPINILQIGYLATDGALPAGSNVEVWGVEA